MKNIMRSLIWFVVVVAVLGFGQWCLDVPDWFDAKEFVLHVVGLVAIMSASDIASWVDGCIRGA